MINKILDFWYVILLFVYNKLSIKFLVKYFIKIVVKFNIFSIFKLYVKVFLRVLNFCLLNSLFYIGNKGVVSSREKILGKNLIMVIGLYILLINFFWLLFRILIIKILLVWV